MILFILISLIVFLLAFCFLLYMFPPVEVLGESMYPTLLDGEQVRGVRISHKKPLILNDIYVFRPPYMSGEDKYVVKRLIYIDYKGRLFFQGDNADYSFDSRDYGLVSRDNVVAHIILKEERK